METPPPGRRLAAIMIADVVGYSRLMEHGEATTHERLQHLRTTILEPEFASHGGQVHRVSGDGFVVEFGSALAATRCALAVQRAFAKANLEAAALPPINLRIGINLGDIIVDGNEIAGNGVNVAARLETLCKPGLVCVSAAVRDQIHDDLGVVFRDLGEQSVKNIKQPIQAFLVEPRPLPSGRAMEWARSVRRAIGDRRLAIAASLLVIAGIATIVAVHPGLQPIRQRIVEAMPFSVDGSVVRWKGASRTHSIAVLPLDNFSSDPEQEYFADGMTDALITDLAKIEALRVTSRTTVMRYKRKQDKSLPEIARELNVDSIVEGSVQRANGKVIITAQLIRAANDEHIWGERFERDMSDVLVLQNDVARSIADQIRVKFTAQDDARLTTKQVVNPAAYEAYLRGEFLRHRWQIAPAVEQFQEAMRIQPDYAQAYGGLALTYMYAPGNLGLTSLQARAKAEPAAQRALELDEKIVNAHLALAAIRAICDYDWPAWEREAKYAIGLNPGLTDGYEDYGIFLGMIGRIDEGIGQLKRAREIDPISADVNGSLGRLYYYAGRYPEAIQRLNEALDVDPDQWIGRVYLVGAYLQQGKYALAEGETAKLPDWFPEKRSLLAWVYAASGQRERALAELSGILRGGKGPPASPWSIAGVYAALGDKDQAFASLDKAYETRFVILASLRVSPGFAPLRQDPRYAALLRKMNLDSGKR